MQVIKKDEKFIPMCGESSEAYREALAGQLILQVIKKGEKFIPMCGESCEAYREALAGQQYLQQLKRVRGLSGHAK